MSKFWNWISNENERTLYFDGYIAQDSWFEDDITPRQFKAELSAGEGDISVWVNSPGGDVFAASQIYTMLKEYQGQVTVKIDGIAASAASVIAMAGNKVLMAPTAVLMIHNPATSVFGEASDLQGAIEMLKEVKESIVNAYEQKTKLSRTKISHMMDSETWFSANKAVELGFADEVLYSTNQENSYVQNFMFDKVTVVNSIKAKLKNAKEKPHELKGVPIEQFDKRLELIKPHIGGI